MNIIKKARISADKRSIDAYGRSVEIAIANYLLETGTFPTSINELTIEYSGDDVVCSTTQLNSDSSVYLTGCRVAGRNVDYAYGTDKSPTYTAYSIGDEVTYNGVDYYVIKDSGASEESVTMLKATPLTVAEVTEYYGSTYNTSGYGGIAYYRKDGECTNSSDSNCKTDYAESDIKKVIDAWANDNINTSDLASDLTGYNVRLITINELKEIGYDGSPTSKEGCDYCILKNDNIPQWIFGNFYDYWTMTLNYSYRIWCVRHDGDISSYVVNDSGYQMYGNGVYGNHGHVVRPVITILKSSISN